MPENIAAGDMLESSVIQDYMLMMSQGLRQVEAQSNYVLRNKTFKANGFYSIH